MLPLVPLIVVLNLSRVPDATVGQWVAAIQRQVHEDLAPVWHLDATVTFVPRYDVPPPGAWQVRLVPGMRTSAYGGYHLSVDDHGVPYADVYDIPGERTDLNLSHEILEMLPNPYDDRYVKDYPYVWNLEIADPVQTRWYVRDGVHLSDFVYPAWFSHLTAPGVQLDHMGAVHEPCQVLTGGVAVRIDFTSGTYARVH